MEKNSNKKKNGIKQNGKKTNNSRSNSKQRIDVYKHFEPTKKTRRSSQDDFPEFSMSDVENYEKPISNTNNKKTKNKRSSNSVLSSETSLKKVSKEQKRCDQKHCFKADRCHATAEYKIPSVATSNGYTASQLQHKIKRNIESINNRDNIRMSVKDMRNKLQERLGKKSTSTTSSRMKKSGERLLSQTKTSETETNPSTSTSPNLTTATNSYVKQLKKEIKCAKPSCQTEDIKQTVSELKVEIGKYRETLNKNFLHERLGPNFFEKSVVCSPTICTKYESVFKNAPMQTEGNISSEEIEILKIISNVEEPKEDESVSDSRCISSVKPGSANISGDSEFSSDGTSDVEADDDDDDNKISADLNFSTRAISSKQQSIVSPMKGVSPKQSHIRESGGSIASSKRSVNNQQPH